MTKLILTVFTILILVQAFGQFKQKGIFVGLEPMKEYSDPSKPKYKWYHLSKLTFKDDSVFLEQSPVALYKRDTLFSASDGGFYSYSGIIQEYKGKTAIVLKLISCDYCPMQMLRFTPPKIIDDNDTTNIAHIDTSLIIKPPTEIENPKMEYKVLFIEDTKDSNRILVNRNVYRQQKK